MFTQCCKAGMNHSLFVVSHEESPGKWDATSDTGLVSEVFVGGFKCVGKDKQGSALEKKHFCDVEGQWFLGLALFPLNKVPLVFIKHGGGYSVEIRSDALHSCTSLSSGSRKANRLPSSQVITYIKTFTF